MTSTDSILDRMGEDLRKAREFLKDAQDLLAWREKVTVRPEEDAYLLYEAKMAVRFWTEEVIRAEDRVKYAFSPKCSTCGINPVESAGATLCFSCRGKADE